jgi:soluble lytic murein transglycosylase-like protein
MGEAVLAIFKRTPIIVGALIVCTISVSVHSAVYVYRASDGSLMLTDYVVKSSKYRLLRKTGNVRGAAAIAQRGKRLDRGNPSAYDRLIRRTARTYGVDAALVKAVIHAESAFNPYATSHKGASGLMQLMPATAERYGVDDIYDPVQNVRAGVHYLKELMQLFDNKHHLVAAAYNAGENAVKEHKGVPPYTETRNYVKKVLRFKRRYSKKF